MASHTLERLTFSFFFESSTPVRVKISDFFPDGYELSLVCHQLKYFATRFLDAMKQAHPKCTFTPFTSADIRNDLLALGEWCGAFECFTLAYGPSHIYLKVALDIVTESLIIEPIKVSAFIRDESITLNDDENRMALFEEIFEHILGYRIQAIPESGVHGRTFRRYYDQYISSGRLEDFIAKRFSFFDLVKEDSIPNRQKTYQVDPSLWIIFSLEKGCEHPIRKVKHVSSSMNQHVPSSMNLQSFLEGLLRKVHASNDKYATLVDEMIARAISQDSDPETMKFILDLSGKMKDTASKDVVGYAVCYALEMLCQCRLSN